MSNYPNGFNPAQLNEPALDFRVEDDHNKIHRIHGELLDCLREMRKAFFFYIDQSELEDTILTVDQMYRDLVAGFYNELESETGIVLDRPIAREAVQRKARSCVQNPQTLKDIAAANAAAAASVFEKE